MSLAKTNTFLNLSGINRLPIVRQNELSECGLACLTMIAGFYGYKTNLATLRRTYSTSLQGMTLKSVMDIADKLGLGSRPIKLPLALLGKVKSPAILHWDMNHYVVLKSVRGNKVTIHDPAQGKRTYTFDEVSKHFSGVALELFPTDKFQKRAELVKLRLSDLWGRIFGLKRNLLQILALSTVLQFFVLASPFYLQITVDEVLTKFDTDLLLVLALSFGGFALLNFITTIIRGYSVLYFSNMLSFQMTSNLFHHLLRLPVDFFEKRHLGDIVSRFTSMEPIRKMLTEGLVASVIDGLMAITTFLLMYIYSPLLTLISFAAFGFYFVLRLAFYKSFKARQEDLIVSEAIENSIFMESIRGITSLKLFGAENDRQTLWQNRFADTINAGARFEKLQIWFNSANTGIFGIEHIVIIYTAANMVLNTEFTVGMIFAFMAYKRNFTDKAIMLVERVIDFKMLELHLERIADIAHSEQEEQSQELGLASELKPLQGSLSIQKISYAYSVESPEVLKSISFSIEPGQTIAIVGQSGCGKTTLLKVMAGLMQPRDGEILVDGQPLSSYGLSSYRRQIGVVMQDDDLFSGTIAENITFFHPDGDMQQVIQAATLAMVHDDVMAMPMNYESLVGDMGAALSGGQKQRLMLARAIYRQPKILFMDEGTAHLDVTTERAVNESLAQLKMTRVIVAHRPETIMMADRICEMKAGVLNSVSKKVYLDRNQNRDRNSNG